MFQQTHRTSGGDTLLIAQMEDEHLLNMIGQIVAWAERASGELHRIIVQTQEAERNNANGSLAMAEAQRKMYGLPPLPDLQDATGQYASAMNSLSAKLEPYLLEAWTRSLDEMTEAALAGLRERWQAAVGRTTALPHPKQYLALDAGTYDDEDDVPF